MSKNTLIPRSKSVPCRISETQNVRSTNSDDSLKPSWHKKIDEERKRGSSSSKNSRSKNNLDEFNKRNAIQEEKRYSARSPYYKGLTDSSKEINRQKSLAGSTHGKDSSLSSSSTSNSSKSNLAIKVRVIIEVYDHLIYEAYYVSIFMLCYNRYKSGVHLTLFAKAKKNEHPPAS